LLSWYVIFYKALKLKKQYGFYKNFIAQISQNNNWIYDVVIAKKLDKKIDDNSFELTKSCIQSLITTSQNLQNTLEKYHNNDTRKEILAMHLNQNLDEIRFWLDRGLTILASIGSSAPFIGLFGTVWGIYHALGDIASLGSSGLDVVAGPISEALIATAIGLFTAIPAVLAYNSFIRLNRLLVQNLRHIAEQISVYTSNNHHKILNNHA
jgi:biopolymer transport protein ExbB